VPFLHGGLTVHCTYCVHVGLRKQQHPFETRGSLCTIVTVPRNGLARRAPTG
jgi:hypothetical protein